MSARPTVYTASRWTRGNLLFPDRLRLEPEAVVFEKRHLIGGEEETIRYEQIASVSIQRGFLFAELLFETTGGSEPVFLNGVWIRAAERAKRDLDARVGGRGVDRDQRVIELLEEQNELLRRLVTRLGERA